MKTQEIKISWANVDFTMQWNEKQIIEAIQVIAIGWFIRALVKK